ncbi:MAG: hypothetical protein NT031_10305 [Planctomycetota bacterium]|nr:hypothetical protein [Planctomycetota bacterium]
MEIAIRPPKQAATAAGQAIAAEPDRDYNDRYNDPFFFSLQDYMDRDYVAPVIVGLAAAFYLLAASRQRSLLLLLLGLLAVNFTFRELRDNPGLEGAVESLCGWLGVTHTKKTWDHFMTAWVYRFAGALAVVAGVFWRKIDRAVRADWRHTSWVLAIFAAYAVCMIVQRRALRFCGPWEQHIHRSLEECTEDVAHAVFVVASLVALCRKKPASPVAA